MPSPASKFIIDAKRDWVHWIGDSLVEWMGNTPPGGGIAGPLMWQIHGAQAAANAPANGYPQSPLDTAQNYLMPFTQSGAAGTGIHYILETSTGLNDNIGPRVIAPLKAGGIGRSGRAKLIWQCSVNDGGALSGPATYDAWFPSIYSQIIAAFGSNLDVLMLPVLFSGDENWNAAGAGAWAGLAGETNDLINGSNAHYKIIAGNVNWWWADWRGLTLADTNSMLYQESLVNSGHLSTNVVTLDGIHPKTGPGQRLAIQCLNNFLDIRY